MMFVQHVTLNVADVVYVFDKQGLWNPILVHFHIYDLFVRSKTCFDQFVSFWRPINCDPDKTKKSTFPK